jgi:hypothetical protein
MSLTAFQAKSLALGGVVGGGLAAVFALAFSTHSYNLWGAVIVVPILVAVNAILIWRAASGHPEPWLAGLLGVAFVAKMIGTLVRYYVAYTVYDGAADAERYNLYAAYHFRAWREGSITWSWTDQRGTQYMELITTAIYTITGPTTLAAFLVYASFAFWGAYLLYRAFQVALPDGNHKRYALLVFFLPSLLYWPSSIGKESWLLLFVGVTALGAAKFFSGQRGAFLLLGVGAVGTAIIRPHIAVLLFAALLVAQLFRPATAHATGILSKLAGIAVMGAAAWVLTQQSAEFLGTDDLSWQAISESLAMAGGRTAQGGSQFTPVEMTSPLGFPAAAVTILFRPFPWEASSIQLLVQSLEGVFLLGLTIASWPRLRRLPGILKGNPYVVFAVVYMSAFIVAFSGFANFGILARQRVLLLPFFLVLLALPLRRKNEGDQVALEREERAEDSSPGVFRRV